MSAARRMSLLKTHFLAIRRKINASLRAAAAATGAVDAVNRKNDVASVQNLGATD
jgi:hypothetical protein